MSRPKFPIGIVMTPGIIRRINEEQALYDKDPEEYERREEWSLSKCRERGCLPTGEPLEAAFGPGEWSKWDD